MFSRSRNQLLTFLLSYHVRVTSKIQVNFRYRRYSKVYWWFCLMNFWNFFNIHVFGVKKSIADIPTELPCSSDLENSVQLPVQEVLEGTDDSVLWIFEISSVFMFSGSRNPLLTFLLSYHVQWPRKSRSTSGTGCTRRYWWYSVLWIFEISSMFMFSRSRNPLLAFLLSYHVRVT